MLLKRYSPLRPPFPAAVPRRGGARLAGMGMFRLDILAVGWFEFWGGDFALGWYGLSSMVLGGMGC
jgi:hypothetical protein